jgi:uncharacterized protein (DUF58 family)
MKFVKALYLRTKLFTLLAGVACLYVICFFLPFLSVFPTAILIGTIIACVIEYVMLFSRSGFRARRFTGERFSNGDENPVRIFLHNLYPFAVRVVVVDELPQQFQQRDNGFGTRLEPGAETEWDYALRPVKRGEYSFGALHVYVHTSLGLLMRRYTFDEQRMVPVYPSFLQMRKYQLLAISNRLSEIGVKKIRRVGHSMEFEQIRDYVKGDDIRTLNWKATARRGQLMVNGYSDEKSQQVYCLIDKGRAMRMPFAGMSLLDHAINASLVLCNTALIRQDKAGVISFAEEVSGMVPATRNPTQMTQVLEHLYRQKTRYLESDYEKLYSAIRHKVNQRSLLILFTNFESLYALQRQLPYLRRLARQHLLLVVFFENTGLDELIRKPAGNVEDIYNRTIAQKFAFEKKLIVRELQKLGILTVLTAPENLTIDTVNKYLEIKARQMI